MDTPVTNSTKGKQPVKTKQQLEDESQSTAGGWILGGALILGLFVVGYFSFEERRKADESRDVVPVGLEDVESQWRIRRNVKTLPPPNPPNPNSPDGLYKVTGTTSPSYIQDYHDQYKHLNRLVNFGNPIANIAWEEFNFTHFKPDHLTRLIRVVHGSQEVVSNLFKCFPLTTNHFSCDYIANYSVKMNARTCSSCDIKKVLDDGEYIGYIEIGFIIIPISKIIFGSKISNGSDVALPIRFRRSFGMNKVQVKFGHRMVLHNNSRSFTRYGVNYDILNINGALGMPGGHLLPGAWTCPIFEPVHDVSLTTTEEFPVIVREDSDGIQPTSFTSTTFIYKVKVLSESKVINKEWLTS